MCLSYSFQKWRKRVTNKLSLFKAIPCHDLSRAHSFVYMREHICQLFDVYVSLDAEIGKPNDKTNWRNFGFHLRDTKIAIQGFLDTDPFSGNDAKRYAGFSSPQRYLHKIIGTLNQLDILRRVARSPSCKHLFSFCLSASRPCQISQQILPQFPRGFGVIREEYSLLAGVWLMTYHGYRPKNVEHRPGSTVSFGNSDHEIIGDRELFPYGAFIPPLVESFRAPSNGDYSTIYFYFTPIVN